MPRTASDAARRVGEAVRALRLAQGISQEALAHHINVHRTFVGQVERGLTNLSLANLLRIATGLGIRPGDLLNAALPEVPKRGGRARKPRTSKRLQEQRSHEQRLQDGLSPR